MPQYAEKSSILADVLTARGDINGITDEEGLAAWAGEIGDIADGKFTHLKACLEWGSIKEGFALHAANRNLKWLLRKAGVACEGEMRMLETGFTSCTARRFDPCSSTRHKYDCRSKFLAQESSYTSTGGACVP